MATFLSNPHADEWPQTADVVIIGGGPAGTAALWALSRLDPTLKLVLIEADTRLGAGSSTASLENYRTAWATACIAAQVWRSVEVFHHADDYLGNGASQAIHLKQQGYLFCAFDDHHATNLRRDVEHLHRLGIHHVEYLDIDEVNTRYPWLAGRVVAAKYDPVAGWLDSNALIYRFAQSAENAMILLGIKDTCIRTANGKVIGIKTAIGKIDAPRVVIACGANAIHAGRTAGIELPVILRPRQSFTTPWRHPEFPTDAPMLIAGPPFPHVRPEAQTGAIFGWEYQWYSKHAGEKVARIPDALIEPLYPLHQLKDPRFPSIVLLLLARQFGYADGEGFAHPRYLQGISHNIGYYVYRSDAVAYTTNANGDRQPYESERALIDAVPGVEGLFASVAHVGHGIMTAPAAGEIIACKVLDQPPADPLFAQFGFDVPWVEFDENAL